MPNKYELDDASVLLGREAAKHGDWRKERHQAAVELFEAVATLASQQRHFLIKCDPGNPRDHRQPPTLHFDFGDAQVQVTYAAGKFGAFSPDGKHQVDFDLEFNGYLLAFESAQDDPHKPGKRRPAAAVLLEAVIANLRM